MQLPTFENDVRLTVYRHFVSECRAPAISDVARALDAEPEKVRRAFHSLAEQHVLVLEAGSEELLMAMPFSAIPTTYRVRVGESSWWAN